LGGVVALDVAVENAAACLNCVPLAGSRRDNVLLIKFLIFATITTTFLNFVSLALDGGSNMNFSYFVFLMNSVTFQVGKQLGFRGHTQGL
jgi:hypothetical protein